MKIEYWYEIDLREDGRLGDPVDLSRGTMGTKPEMKTSYAPHLKTPSAKANPWWMLVTTGRLKDGSIHGITIWFDTEKEMRDFFAKPIVVVPPTEETKNMWQEKIHKLRHRLEWVHGLMLPDDANELIEQTLEDTE